MASYRRLASAYLSDPSSSKVKNIQSNLMAKERLVIIGAGGLGRELAALIHDINQHNESWDILGFIDDDTAKRGTTCGPNDHPGVWAAVALGNGDSRRRIVAELPNMRWATLVHPLSLCPSICAPVIGEGTVVFGATVLSTDVNVGSHCVVSYGCTIAHDVDIKDYVTMLLRCSVAGDVQIGEGATLGTESTVAHGICISNRACLAAGSVVVHNLPAACFAAGVPARVKKTSYSCTDFWH